MQIVVLPLSLCPWAYDKGQRKDPQGYYCQYFLTCLSYQTMSSWRIRVPLHPTAVFPYLTFLVHFFIQHLLYYLKYYTLCLFIWFIVLSFLPEYKIHELRNLFWLLLYPLNIKLCLVHSRSPLNIYLRNEYCSQCRAQGLTQNRCSKKNAKSIHCSDKKNGVKYIGEWQANQEVPCMSCQA